MVWISSSSCPKASFVDVGQQLRQTCHVNAIIWVGDVAQLLLPHASCELKWMRSQCQLMNNSSRTREPTFISSRAARKAASSPAVGTSSFTNPAAFAFRSMTRTRRISRFLTRAEWSVEMTVSRSLSKVATLGVAMSSSSRRADCAAARRPWRSSTFYRRAERDESESTFANSASSPSSNASKRSPTLPIRGRALQMPPSVLPRLSERCIDACPQVGGDGRRFGDQVGYRATLFEIAVGGRSTVGIVRAFTC